MPLPFFVCCPTCVLHSAIHDSSDSVTSQVRRELEFNRRASIMVSRPRPGYSVSTDFEGDSYRGLQTLKFTVTLNLKTSDQVLNLNTAKEEILKLLIALDIAGYKWYSSVGIHSSATAIRNRQHMVQSAFAFDASITDRKVLMLIHDL